MKAKNLVILAVVAVVLVGLARLSSSKKSRLSKVEETIGKPLLEALQDATKLNSVEKLVFESAAGTLTIAKKEGAWVAADAYDYPVKFDSVHGFLTNLAKLETGQSVSDTQLASLELLSPATAGPGESGTLVKLLDAADGVVATLVVGKEHQRKAQPDSQFAAFGGYPDGRFVAVDGKGCLVSETLSNLPDDPKDWLDKELANVTASDVQSVSVTGTNGESLELAKTDGATDLLLTDLAEGEETDTSKSGNLCSVLSWLNFDDLADPAATDEALGFDKALVCKATTKQGQVYTLTLGGSPEGSDSRYVRLKGDYVPPPLEAEESAPAETESDDEKTEEQKQAEQEAARKKEEERSKQAAEQETLAAAVAELNSKVGGWTYVVSSYEVEAVTTDRATFVKEKEEAEAEAPETAPETAKAPAPPVVPPPAPAPAPPAPAPDPPVTVTGPAKEEAVSPPAPAPETAPEDK